MQNFFNANFYSVVAAIALLVHLVIDWKQLFDWRNAKRRAGALEFRQFLVCLTVFFVADVLWGFLAQWHRPRLLYADTAVFFLTMALSVYFWTRFIVAYMEMGGGQRGRLLWMGRVLLAFFVAALALNAFTGHFFTVDDRCVYTAGPIRQAAFSLLAAFNAYVSVAALPMMPRTAGALRRRCKMLVAVGLTMAAAILVQLGDPFLPLYSLGTLFALCFLHVFVVEDERDEMHRQELLALDYGARLEAERRANQAKSLFFSTISHDIRTPLNAIVGFSELLDRSSPDAAERSRYVSIIRSSAKLLGRLVDDVLDLSKMESGKLDILEEPTDIPSLAREVISACEVALAGKPVVLRSAIDPVPWVSVDPLRVRQLLFNLISNACKYTDRGAVTVRIAWRNSTLSLAISDTGKGISRQDIDRILQPFVQLADKNHRDGTGLGLPICQRLAALMGGRLEIHSEEGVGSTFTVILPALKTVDPPEDRLPNPADRPLHTPSHVLVVDDSPVNRAVLSAMLAKAGVPAVVMAENGREALAMLKHDPAIDFVLTDLWMPELDGHGLVRAIRADPSLAHLPVHLVTADVEARAQATANGFTGLLLKPITLDGLRSLFA